MPIQQLSCRDLAPGDVLLKQTAGAFSSKLITLGQKASQAVMPSQQRGLNPDVVHAGIMFDNHFIIEAQRAAGSFARPRRSSRASARGIAGFDGTVSVDWEARSASTSAPLNGRWPKRASNSVTQKLN